VRIRVGDQARLQHFVGRVAHALNNVLGLERRLLHFGKIVLGIAIQNHPREGGTPIGV